MSHSRLLSIFASYHPREANVKPNHSDLLDFKLLCFHFAVAKCGANFRAIQKVATASLQFRSFTPATQSNQEIALDVETSEFNFMCFGEYLFSPTKWGRVHVCSFSPSLCLQRYVLAVSQLTCQLSLMQTSGYYEMWYHRNILAG